jgi:hypothetical protein
MYRAFALLWATLIEYLPLSGFIALSSLLAYDYVGNG